MKTMPQTRRTVLYGNTIFLAGLAVQCANRPGLEIMMIDADRQYAEQQLEASSPHVIVFDLTASHPERAFHLLQKNPDLVLVGVDVTSDQVLVLSGHSSPVLTSEDLLKVIEEI
jgi:hypothetical protein